MRILDIVNCLTDTGACFASSALCIVSLHSPCGIEMFEHKIAREITVGWSEGKVIGRNIRTFPLRFTKIPI
jgi:hypothetical protein